MIRDALHLRMGPDPAALTRFVRAAEAGGRLIEAFTWQSGRLACIADDTDDCARIAHGLHIPTERHQVVIAELGRGMLAAAFERLTEQGVAIRAVSGLIGDRLTGHLLLDVDDPLRAEAALAGIALGTGGGAAAVPRS